MGEDDAATAAKTSAGSSRIRQWNHARAACSLSGLHGSTKRHRFQLRPPELSEMRSQFEDVPVLPNHYHKQNQALPVMPIGVLLFESCCKYAAFARSVCPVSRL